jgi:hypothetical protein
MGSGVEQHRWARSLGGNLIAGSLKPCRISTAAPTRSGVWLVPHRVRMCPPQVLDGAVELWFRVADLGDEQRGPQQIEFDARLTNLVFLRSSARTATWVRAWSTRQQTSPAISS